MAIDNSSAIMGVFRLIIMRLQGLWIMKIVRFVFLFNSNTNLIINFQCENGM